MNSNQIKEYISTFKKDLHITNFRIFKDRAFIFTSEASKDKFLEEYPNLPEFYREIITEKIVNTPEIINPRKVFFYFGEENETSDKKIINALIKKILKVNGYKHPDGTSHLSRYFPFSKIKNLISDNLEDLEKITEQMINPYEYLRMVYASQEGINNFLFKYVRDKGFKYFECENCCPMEGDTVILGGVSYALEIHNFLKYITPTTDRIKEQGYIYAFEPSKTKFAGIEHDLSEEDKKRCKLINRALSDENEIFNFIEDGENSRIDPNGTEKVSAIKLDSEYIGVKCDLLKLNINGHELDALKGAVKMIRVNRPKLMIRMIPKNIIEIPKLILDIHPDYKFYVGYYDQYNYFEDIILYAY